MASRSQIKNLVKQAVKKFGTVDILINNAGRGYDAYVEEIDPNDFTILFNLNLLGPLSLMQEVLPIMKKQKLGSVINISSGIALMFLEGISAYSSLKRALVGISLTAREEFKEFGIAVSVVYPYITSTNFEKNTLKSKLIKTQRRGGGAPMRGDSPEYLAGKILEAIETGNAEVFAHDWMGKRQK